MELYPKVPLPDGTDVERDPRSQVPAIPCDICGAPMQEHHCKLACPVCGFTRDCSDP